MRKRVIQEFIGNCKECPNCVYYSGGMYECTITDEKIWGEKRGDDVGKNCPLPFAGPVITTPLPPAVTESELVEALEPPMMQHPPIRQSEEDPAWVQVIKLFKRHGMDEPPVRLRDEIVVALEWAWYGRAVAERLANIGKD